MKKNSMMFSVLLPLGSKMRSGENCPPCPSCGNAATDEGGAWRSVTDSLASYGFNSVLIDVGDAVEYESHPEVSGANAWSKEAFKKELDRIRKLGLTPYPKLNFSAAHDDWLKVYSRMPGTDLYRKVAADLMKEVYELFSKPKFFHLGMDEETPLSQQHLQFSCVRRNGVLWKDMFHLFHTCESLGSMPWIWSDSYQTHPQEFFYNMPKSVLQCPRSDLAEENGLSLWQKSVEALDRAGYRYALCCSDSRGNDVSQEVMETEKHRCDPQGLAGFFTEPFLENKELKTELLSDFSKAKANYFPQ